jgi:NADP-dependent 3-hydroxy acid dehydrogenase YdfG
MSVIKLNDSTSIVTGASRGFGRAIAIALVAQGARVIGVARDEVALRELGQQLGTSFTPMAADVSDPTVASRLVTEHQPQLLVLNAGAQPQAATIQDQTWSAFSENWNVDVRQVFEFTQQALTAPLKPGSCVISLSSGAARMGSPLSGGYAGAKATINFISTYARLESDRASLGIRFVSVLPKLTPATEFGSAFVDAYADYSGIDRARYRSQIGAPLAAEQVATAIIDIASSDGYSASAYLLTADGLAELS